jgi:transcriptional regulator with XRE-family HTH domain
MKSLLRQARERAGQTIVEVCKAVSVDPGNLSRVENGKQKPSTELAEKLAKHFGEPLTEMQILYPERFSSIELDRVSPNKREPSGVAPN